MNLFARLCCGPEEIRRTLGAFELALVHHSYNDSSLSIWSVTVHAKKPTSISCRKCTPDDVVGGKTKTEKMQPESGYLMNKTHKFK